MVGNNTATLKHVNLSELPPKRRAEATITAAHPACLQVLDALQNRLFASTGKDVTAHNSNRN